MSNPFHKPTTPKNSWQLLQWLIFEPVLFKRYEHTLTKIQTTIIVLKAIFINFIIIIIPLTLVVYAISVIAIAVFDLFTFPPNINNAFAQQWQTYSTWWEKVYFFVSFENYDSLKKLADSLIRGLVLGLIAGLTGALARGLTNGLTVGLGIGLGISLVLGLTLALTGGLGVGLLATSLAITLIGGLILSLAFSLGFSLLVSLAISGVFGSIPGLLFLLFFYFNHFHLWFYPWHFFKSQLGVSLTNNPYINDGAIWLPIWGVTNKLIAQARQEPATGLAFANFLLEYRPLQRRLAMRIANAANQVNDE